MEGLPVHYAEGTLFDIRDIYAFIARDNPAAAAMLLAAIAEAVSLLSLFPGKSRKTRRRNIRALPLSRYPYIVFFKVEAGGMTIVHVRHGARRHPGFQEEVSAFVG
jgi:plasmid stabilization system protein ParE